MRAHLLLQLTCADLSDVFSVAFNDNPAGAAHILGDDTLSVSSASSSEAPPTMPGPLLNAALALPQVVDTLGELLSPYSSSKHEADGQRVAKYSPKYRLSFTLLNEDVSSIGYRAWEIEQSIYRACLRPCSLVTSKPFYRIS